MRRASYNLRNRASINRQRRHHQALKAIRRNQRQRRGVFYLQEQQNA